MGATSTDGTTWTTTNVQLRYSIRGRSFYGGRFVSTNNYGVYGTSTNSFGVYGTSTNHIGVYGTSTNYIGVYGTSTNSIGVYGSSTNSTGVYGSSTNSTGVYGSSTNSYSGRFERNTATPTGAVPVVLIFQDHASDPNAALRVRQDGTGNIAEFQGDITTVAYIKKNGGIVTSSSIQIGDDTAAASSANKGAIRYRENAGGSFYEMVMKQTDGSYSWTAIVSHQ